MQNEDRHLNRVPNKPQHPESIEPTIEHQQSQTTVTQNEPPRRVIHFDQQAFLKSVKEHKTVVDFIGQLQALFFNLNIGQLALENIPNLIERPRDFVFEIIVKKNPPQISGLRISESEARKMVEMPEGFQEIENHLKLMKFSLPVDTHDPSGRANVREFISKMEIDEAGKIVLKQSVKDALRSGAETVAETEFTESLDNAATSLLNVLNTNSGEFDSPGKLLALMSNLFVVNTDTKEITLNHKTIALYNRPLRYTLSGSAYRG
jgi:hypothetical protein